MKAYLNEKLNDIFTNNNIAGMCVAVTNRREVIYKKGFGCESMERASVPISPDALFRVASVTKPVTGFTLARLCQDGILSMDMPISKYVPWLKLPGDFEKTITIKMLLSHTSGLPSEYTPDGPADEAALEESLKKELACVEMAFSPNEGKYLYSNLGIRLASYIAEQKTGKPYSELAKKYVLNPLCMNNSSFDLRCAATYPLALPHEDINGRLTVMHRIKENAARLAAGGLYSNTEDLSRLARCILNDGKADDLHEVVSKSVLEQMLVPLTDAKGSDVDGYGITIMKKHYSGGVMYGHLGNADPYGASVFADRQKGIAVVTLMNTFRKDVRLEVPSMILEYFN